MNLKLVSKSLLILVAFLMGIRVIHEPDLWWMLKTGEWISQNGVPKQDPFSYTFSGVEWINVKWLFEWVVFYWSKIFGVEWITLLQATVNVGLVLVLINLMRLMKAERFLANLLSIFIFLFLSEFRMLNRPEMTSLLLSAVFIWLWMKQHYKPDRLIWLIVLLQVLWTNAHEAYAIGLVISGSFVIGKFISTYRVTRTVNLKTMKTELLVLVASYAGTVIHPYGLQMLLHPLEIFGQLGSNKFTTELYGIETSYYWDNFQPIVLAAIAVVLIAITLFNKGKWREIIKALPTGYYVIAILFLYLGTTAHRNLPFTALVLTPFVALGLGQVKWFVNPKPILRWTFIGLLILTIPIISSDQYYQKTNSRNNFGVGVTTFNNPVGASDFINEQGITGKAFTDYLVSSYLLWDQPDFKTYIDFRDLDIFPATFFNRMLRITEFPTLFVEEDAKRNFDYVVLYRPQFTKLHKYLYHAPDWSLKFVDPVAAVYVKESSTSQEVSFTVGNEPIIQGAFASFFSKIWWPFEKEWVNTTDEFRTGVEYFLSVSAYSKALEMVENYRATDQDEANLKEGIIYLSMADEAVNAEERNRILSKSAFALQEVLKISANNAEALYNLGYCYFKAGDYTNAQSFLVKALKSDDQLFNAYVLLAECQNAFMQTDQRNAQGYANKWFEYMLKAHAIQPDDVLTNYKLGVSYCQRNNCEDAKPFLKNLTQLPQLTDAENSLLADCRKRCIN